MLRASHIQELTEPARFWWATGIEDTFITTPHKGTGRMLDEYELTGHYAAWREDLNLVRELGVNAMRYGIPWHRVRSTPATWDWEWIDRPLGKLLEDGIPPIVDLVHYGTPLWMDDAFLSPDFPTEMAEYAARVAERFKGQIHAYTPLNEPRITAWYCGRIGWWPPFGRSWSSFVRVVVNVCHGIVTTVEVLREVDADIVPVHVDATDLYETADELLRDEVKFRQDLVFLPLDLISGRVTAGHALREWLLRSGVKEGDLDWFQEHAVDLPLVGVNLYPMFSRKILSRRGGRLRIQMPYASAEIVDHLCALYAERYGCPVFISETASVGSVQRRSLWLRDSVAAVSRLRREGVPVIGYTWWPLFALVTWAYRQGTRDPRYYLKQMGLWDLVPEPSGELRRARTRLVDEFARLVAGECATVGPLASRPRRAGDEPADLTASSAHEYSP